MSVIPVNQHLITGVGAGPRALGRGMMYTASGISYSVIGLTASKVGVRVGYGAALFQKAEKVARLLTSVAYILSGSAQVIAGGLKLFWAVKKSQFHRKLSQALEGQHPQKRAEIIWRAFESHMQIDSSKIDKKMEKFGKKSLEQKESALLQDYQKELGGWLDYFADIGWRFKKRLYRLFRRNYTEPNTVQDRHNQIKSKLIEIRVRLTTLQGVDREEAIDGFKKERLEDKAKRAHLSAMSSLVSSTFADELYLYREKIDIKDVNHQLHLDAIYKRISTNYHKGRVADIVEGVAFVVVGIISIALATTLGVAGIGVTLSVAILGSIIYVRAVMGGINLLRYLAGAELGKTFDREVYDLFKRFDGIRVIDISEPHLKMA